MPNNKRFASNSLQENFSALPTMTHGNPIPRKLIEMHLRISDCAKTMLSCHIGHLERPSYAYSAIFQYTADKLNIYVPCLCSLVLVFTVDWRDASVRLILSLTFSWRDKRSTSKGKEIKNPLLAWLRTLTSWNVVSSFPQD